MTIICCVLNVNECSATAISATFTDDITCAERQRAIYKKKSEKKNIFMSSETVMEKQPLYVWYGVWWMDLIENHCLGTFS